MRIIDMAGISKIINIISINAMKLIDIGFIDVAKPKTKSILNKFEPITLPIAISVSPFLIATIEVTNSGSEVPTETIVNPTRLALIPRVVAIDVAESTTISPPIIIPTTPIILSSIVLSIDVSCTVASSPRREGYVALCLNYNGLCVSKDGGRSFKFSKDVQRAKICDIGPSVDENSPGIIYVYGTVNNTNQ